MSKGAGIDEELSRALISLSSFITAQITLHVISVLQSLLLCTYTHIHTHSHTHNNPLPNKEGAATTFTF